MNTTINRTKKIRGADFGVQSNHEQMPNGELRFRLTATDGSSYVRTVAGKHGGWQKSHYHERLHEVYIVEFGWIAFAKFNDLSRDVSLTRVLAKELIKSTPFLKHNIYFSADTVVHTVKYGAGFDDPDWHPAPDLDDLANHLIEDDILRRADRPADK